MSSWGHDQEPRPAVYIDEKGVLTIGGSWWAVALAPGDYTLTYILGSAGFLQVMPTRPMPPMLEGVTEIRVYGDGRITVISGGREIARDLIEQGKGDHATT